VALIVGAIIADAVAYRALAVSRSTGTWKASCCRHRRHTDGHVYPLVEIGKSGPNGLGPYAVGFVFALGVLARFFVYNLYFLRFPIDGPRLRFGDYLRGNSWVHFLGIIGGMVWIAGSSRTSWPPAPRRSCRWDRHQLAIGQGSTWWGAVGACWVWKDRRERRARERLLVPHFVLF